MSYPLHAVATKAPLRVSFLGGGTDSSAFPETDDGLDVSMAIQRLIYVTVKRHSPIFGERYRISYFETEHVNSIDEVLKEIIRALIELIGSQEPLFIATATDVPAMSGLSSPSSFAGGLLNALRLITGDSVSAGQLAEEACEVKISILQKLIGEQNQHAAAFRGFNSFKIQTEGRVSVDAITQDREASKLLNGLVMLWTGVPRMAESIPHELNQ